MIGRDRDYLKLYTYQTERLAFLVLSAVVNKLAFQPHTSNSVVSVARNIMTAVINDLTIEENNNKHPVLTAYVEKKYKSKSALYRKRIVNKMLKDKTGAKLSITDNADLVRIGSNLLAMLLDCTDLIYKYKQVRKGAKPIFNLKLTDIAYSIIDNLTENGFIFYLNYPIFVTPPKERVKFIDTGGYYSYDKLVPFVKSKDNMGILKSKIRKEPNILKPLIDLTNNISKTPWRINKTVIDVMSVIYDEQILDHRKDYMLIGDLPNNQLPTVDELLPLNYDGNNEAYQNLCDNRLKLESELDSIRGKALSIHLALNLAKKYDKYEKLYFTYQVDFRSRLYPLQQLLNPQGSKHIKSMLEFAEGEPLDTPDAYKWFMVHGANCFGYDKELYDDRVRLAEGFKQLAEDVSNDPFSNLEWVEADSPFQFLAWLLEYNQYLEYPKDFVSHIPIALDATCSGIQIYSGVMRDKKGAESVNVICNPDNISIADIYGDVANVVNRFLETGDHDTQLTYKTSDDIEHNIDIRPICQSMSGNINRKITKKNVMTFPYNVSIYGMREQLREDIIKDYEGTNKQFWTGEGWLASRVLADLNYRGIEEVVKGAVVCRDFLKELTKEVCEKGNYIYYKTPFIGFPVVHRITRTNIKRIRTNLGRLAIKQPTNNLHVSRMVNGIAPNFVHSLDATLMYMTIQKLIDKGVRDYALIHDSFGVHARYAGELQLKVREAYVELFEEDVLQQFVDIVAPFKTGAVKDLMIDDLDLQQVHDSPYMFS